VPAAPPTATQPAAPETAPAATPNAAHHGHGHHRHHRFDDAEAWAKQFDDPSRDAWQKPEAVIDFIAPAADAVVADLGAGTGYFAVRFAKRVPQGRVLANDIEPDMVRYLGERAAKDGLTNLVAVLGTADAPGLTESVDVAFMCDVYHHIEDRAAYFTKVVDRLQPGGRVVIVDFKKDAPADIPGPPPAMRVSQDDVVEELSAVGLKLSRADRDTLPYQYVLELSVR
jgi:ubiquinone/menaquinone biosynthesis C-methylase UbiE